MSSHARSCLPNLNYFISITCPDNKFTSGHGRRISPSPGAAFVHAHPIDRTSHLQVWGVHIIVIGLQSLIKMVDLPFYLAISLIILYCFTASMNYWLNIASCNATVLSDNDLRLITGLPISGWSGVCPLLPFEMDCNFRCISIDNFLFIFTFYFKLAIAKLVRDIKNGGKPLSLFCVYILPLISIDGSDKLFYSTC